VDITSPYALVRGKECVSHREAATNLLDFMNRSDISKRRINAQIPYFTSGSYVSVTKSDPYSPSGESTFAGICISTRKCQQLGSTFVLRNVINGIGVEMMYELYSPANKEIKVLKLERRVRAKLYYLRDKPLKYSTVNEKMEPIKSPEGPVPVHRRRGKPA
jgi:large subunit ribosomal protein L19